MDCHVEQNGLVRCQRQFVHQVFGPGEGWWDIFYAVWKVQSRAGEGAEVPPGDTPNAFGLPDPIEGGTQQAIEEHMEDTPAASASACTSAFMDWMNQGLSGEVVDRFVEMLRTRGLSEQDAQDSGFEMAEAFNQSTICSEENYAFWQECSAVPGEQAVPGLDSVARYCDW